MDEFNPNEKEDRSNHVDDSEELDIDTVDQSVFIPDQTRDEEFASEMATLDEETIINREDRHDGEDQLSNVPGWIALGLAVLSFFMMPIIIGGAAIIVGFMAKNRGSLWLGNIAIGAGVISIIVRLFFIPFV